MWGRPALDTRVSPLFGWSSALGFRFGPSIYDGSGVPSYLLYLVAYVLIVSLLPGPGPGCVVADFLKASLEVQ